MPEKRENPARAFRALVVDPNAAVALLARDLLISFGATSVEIDPDERSALAQCETRRFDVILVERSGPSLDGVAFARSLRRSEASSRQAALIMVAPEPTAREIRTARDAGVHEFLRKPYAMDALRMRVEAVLLRPREWVEGMRYVGPDRRRFNSGAYSGERKRRFDKATTPEQAAAAAVAQAMQILWSAVSLFDTDPQQALRAIRAQIAALEAHEVVPPPELTCALLALQAVAGARGMARKGLALPKAWSQTPPPASAQPWSKSGRDENSALV